MLWSAPRLMFWFNKEGKEIYRIYLFFLGSFHLSLQLHWGWPGIQLEFPRCLTMGSGCFFLHKSTFLERRQSIWDPKKRITLFYRTDQRCLLWADDNRFWTSQQHTYMNKKRNLVRRRKNPPCSKVSKGSLLRELVCPSLSLNARPCMMTPGSGV
jgi:hypothetical protein